MGWAAPSMRHIIWRVRATETAEVFWAMVLGQLPCGRQQVVGGVEAAHQAAGQRLGGREDVAPVGPLQGPVDAHDPGQEPAGAGLGHDPPAGEDEAHAGVLGREADVHGQGHGDAHADGRTVDGGDDRLEQAEDAQGQQPAAVPPLLGRRARWVVGVVVEGLCAQGEVGAGAEGPARGR